MSAAKPLIGGIRKVGGGGISPDYLPMRNAPPDPQS